MPHVAATPYSELEDKCFWKAGVADVELGTELFDRLHQINIDVKNPRISSVGSCFAQHVGKWLLQGQHSFNQSQLDTEQVSSFAFGNIYTPRSFLQWLDFASAATTDTVDYSIYDDDSTFYDLLRPNFNRLGYDSKAALISARMDAVNEMVETIKQTDVLIFTLGLTEAWSDANGIVYPSCPGVIAGQFDPNIWHFTQFTVEQLRADLEEIANRLVKISSGLSIILTVSPVPLTATATDKHILVANQHSKSVLRAVAGELADTSVTFQYFPSYEIITVPNSNDFRFHENRRTVTIDAVNYVMQHFNTALGSVNADDDLNNPPPQLLTAAEAVCEDELLQASRKLQVETTDLAVFDLTLLGDSHMEKLSRSLNQLGVKHCGGMVMSGSGFAQKKFALCDSEYFVPLENPQSRKLWSVVYHNLAKLEQSQSDEKSTIITNIGMQTHQTLGAFVDWVVVRYPNNLANLGIDIVIEFFNEYLPEQFSLILKLHNAGHRMIVVSDPPFIKYSNESQVLTRLLYTYFDAAAHVWQGFDIEFFNAATAFDAEISDPKTYMSEAVYEDGHRDWVHGNDKYYTWLANKLIKLTTD